MADHIRNQIRDRAVVAVTSLTTTGANVFQTPIITAEEQTLPALCVYVSSESSGVDASVAGVLSRNILLSIDGYADASATILDTLDLIAKEVEVAMATTGIVTSGGATLVSDFWLDSTEIEIDDTGARPLGIVRLAYLANYRTAYATPDVVA